MRGWYLFAERLYTIIGGEIAADVGDIPVPDPDVLGLGSMVSHIDLLKDLLGQAVPVAILLVYYHDVGCHFDDQLRH